jgi:putative endonuclease
MHDVSFRTCRARPLAGSGIQIRIKNLDPRLRGDDKRKKGNPDPYKKTNNVFPKEIHPVRYPMYYVYILESIKDGNFYVGYSEDLKERKKQHDAGKVFSTKNRLPLKLVYYEACLNQQDATHREKYLKTAWGKRYIKNRIKKYIEK